MVEQHYKVSVAAGLLGVSRQWVYDRIASGELTVVELGGGRKNQRIPESVLQSYLDSRTYPRGETAS